MVNVFSPSLSLCLTVISPGEDDADAGLRMLDSFEEDDEVPRHCFLLSSSILVSQVLPEELVRLLRHEKELLESQNVSKVRFHSKKKGKEKKKKKIFTNKLGTRWVF